MLRARQIEPYQAPRKVTPTRTEGAGKTPIPFLCIEPSEIATTTASTIALQTTQHALDRSSTSAKHTHCAPWRMPSWQQEQQQPLHQQQQQPLQRQPIPPPPPPPPPLPQPTTSIVMEPLRPIPPLPRWQDLGHGRGGIPSRVAHAAKRANDPNVQGRAANLAKVRAEKEASVESSVYLQP